MLANKWYAALFSEFLLVLCMGKPITAQIRLLQRICVRPTYISLFFYSPVEAEDVPRRCSWGG
jgi:hypothetical protein